MHKLLIIPHQSGISVTTDEPTLILCMQWLWFHTYIGCDVISQVGLITQIHWDVFLYLTSHCTQQLIIVINFLAPFLIHLTLLGKLQCWLNPAPLLLPPAPALLDIAGGKKYAKHADWFHLKLIISHQEEL